MAFAEESFGLPQLCVQLQLLLLMKIFLLSNLVTWGFLIALGLSQLSKFTFKI